MLHDRRGDSSLRRFDRDVLAQPSVTYVIVLIGINDLRNSARKAEEVVTAEEMIAGLHQFTVRARSAGLRVFGGTLLPYENDTFNGGFYTPEADAKRQAVNTWIRGRGALDAVIDFEAVLRDPSRPTRLLPPVGLRRPPSPERLRLSAHGRQHRLGAIRLSTFAPKGNSSVNCHPPSGEFFARFLIQVKPQTDAYCNSNA